MKQIKKILFIILGLSLPSASFAHVGYVVSQKDISNNLGMDFAYFLQPLSQPKYIALIFTCLATVIFLYINLSNAKWFLNLVKKIDGEAESYGDIYAWMIRLSLGIALIGAGTSGVFISPIQPASSLLASIQTLLGFLLLAGLFTGVASVLVIVLFCFGLMHNFYLLGNLDFLALAFALLTIGDTRPGLDHLLEIPFRPWLKNIKQYASIILRIGAGFAMSFLAIYEKILNPHISAVAVYGQKLNEIIPVSAEMWVFSAGVIELAIGLALIFGFKTRLISAIAFIVLSASFFYFKEAVYSHITLFGTLSILFCTNGKRLFSKI